MALKAGSLVRTHHGRFVLLAKAPVSVWVLADTHETVLDPHHPTPIKDYRGCYYMWIEDERRPVYKWPTSHGRGPAWWVQDADTGEVKDFSVREEAVTLVASPVEAASA